jgi:hypothetical protein
MKNLRSLKMKKAAEQAAKVIHHNYMEDLGALQQFESANISSFTFELKGKARIPLAHVSVSSLPVSGILESGDTTTASVANGVICLDGPSNGVRWENKVYVNTPNYIPGICKLDFSHLKEVEDIKDVLEMTKEHVLLKHLNALQLSPSMIRQLMLVMVFESCREKFEARVQALCAQGFEEIALSPGKAQKLNTYVGLFAAPAQTVSFDLSKDCIAIVPKLDSTEFGDSYDGMAYHHHEWFCSVYGMPMAKPSYHQMRITALSIKVGSQPLHGKSMEAWKQAFLAMDKVMVYGMEDGVIHAEKFSDCYKKGNYNVAFFGNPEGHLLAITDENGMKRTPELSPSQKAWDWRILQFFHETKGRISTQHCQYVV